MITITSQRTTKGHIENFGIVIRKNHDGKFYASGASGLFMKGDFQSVKEASDWALDILPSDLEYHPHNAVEEFLKPKT